MLNSFETCLESAWSQRLEAPPDELRPSFAHKFNVRRYMSGGSASMRIYRACPPPSRRRGLTLLHFSPQPEPFVSLKLHETTQAYVSRKQCSR